MLGFWETVYTKGLAIEYQHPSTIKIGVYFDEIANKWLENNDLANPEAIPKDLLNILFHIHQLSPVFAIKNQGKVIAYSPDQIEKYKTTGVMISDTYGRKGLLMDLAEAAELTLPSNGNILYPFTVPSEITLKSTGQNKVASNHGAVNIRNTSEIRGFSADHPEERTILEHLRGIEDIYDIDGQIRQCEFIPGRYLISSLPARYLTVGSSRFDLADKNLEKVFPLLTGKNLMHSMLFIQHTAYSFRDIDNAIKQVFKSRKFEKGLEELLVYLQSHLFTHPYYTEGNYDLSGMTGRLNYIAYLFTQDFIKNYREVQILVKRGVHTFVRHNQNKHFEGMTDLEGWTIGKVITDSGQIHNMLRTELSMSINLLKSFRLLLSDSDKKSLATLILDKMDLVNQGPFDINFKSFYQSGLS